MSVLSAAVQLGNQQQLGLEQHSNCGVNLITFISLVVTNIYYVVYMYTRYKWIHHSINFGPPEL